MQINLKTLAYSQLISLARRVADELAAVPPGTNRDKLRRAHIKLAEEHRYRLWTLKRLEPASPAM